MIYHLTIIENTKAKLLVDEISIRDKGAKELLVNHYENLGHIIKIRIER